MTAQSDANEAASTTGESSATNRESPRSPGKGGRRTEAYGRHVTDDVALAHTHDARANETQPTSPSSAPRTLLWETSRSSPPLSNTLPSIDSAPIAGTAHGAGDARDAPRTPPWSDDLWIGRLLGNVYRVDAKIGEGGMGAVYVATHIHLGKQYAVKVLNAQVASNETAVERLRQEAVAASSIDHDHIVEVISFDRYSEGEVFIVMELLRGENLQQRLGRGPIRYFEAISIAYQLCSALGAAHAGGIVHRDLKPENVFLAIKGDIERVKVLDFGISKIKSADAEQVRMTRTGQLVGTPLYMSPEQARGETEIDQRVDVYSLGAILYEMLTGAPPFSGRNHFELLWKHGNEKPEPPRRRNPEVHIPAQLEKVILQALAKDRGERFESMDSFADALARACPEIARPSLPSIPAPSRTSGPGSPSGSIEADNLAERERIELPLRKRPAWLVPLAALVGLAVAIVALGSAWSAAPSWPEDGANHEMEISSASESGGESSPPLPTSPSQRAARSEHARSASADAIPTEAISTGAIPSSAIPSSAIQSAAISSDAETTPSHVEVHFESIPSGAEVILGQESLGRTPLTTSLDAESLPTEVVFRHPRYRDSVERLLAEDGATMRVRLRPRPSANRASGAALNLREEL